MARRLMTLDHAVGMYHAMPNAELAIVPGTSQSSMQEIRWTVTPEGFVAHAREVVVVSARSNRRRRWVFAAVVPAVVIGANAVRRRARRQSVPPDSPADVGFMRALHSALRRDLTRLEAVAQQLDGAPPPAVLAGWDAFRRQLDNHHAAEDDDLWPVLRRQLSDPSELAAVDQMVQEHRQIPAALAEVGAALRAGGDLTAPVRHLSTVLRDHLEHEEREVLPLVERHLTRAQWRAFLLTERDRRSALERPEFLTWILDEADEQAAAAVLTEMPPPARLVYRLLLRRRYQRQHRWQLSDQ